MIKKMKWYFIYFLGSMAIIGCATPKEVMRLQSEVQELRTDVMKLISARDRRDRDFDALQGRVDRALAQDATLTFLEGKLEKRVDALDKFKGFHDKRWPHLIDAEKLPAVNPKKAIRK